MAPSRSRACRFWLSLALPLQASDADLQADDGLQHAVDEFTRRVGHLPGLGLRCLMDPREPPDQAAHESLVVMDADLPVHMHGLVVPGGHQAVRLVLAWIPAGRDIAFGATEDDQHLGAVAALLPQRIGAGHMGAQRAHLPRVRIQQERQVVGVQHAVGLGDERAQGVAADQAVQAVGIGEGEMGGRVHGRFLGWCAGIGGNRTIHHPWHNEKSSFVIFWQTS